MDREVTYEIHENKLSVSFKVMSDDFGEDNEVELDGFFKWDGCLNITIGERDCMSHFCDAAMLEAQYKLIRQIVAKCIEMLGDKVESYVKDTWPTPHADGEQHG